MLNTNGIRLARDPRFAPALAEIGVHVYLQFDGFEEATQLAIRGKRPDRGEAAGARPLRRGRPQRVSLAAAVERDVSTSTRSGAIVRFGVEHPAVTGVFFQPVTHSGRFRVDSDPLDKLTNSDVIEAIAAQLPEWFREDDFVPVPCCSPTCRSATFALYDGEDLVPLPAPGRRRAATSTTSPTAASPTSDVREALEGLWSAKAAGGSAPVAARLECVACATAMPAGAARGGGAGLHDRRAGLPGPLHPRRASKLRKCCVAEIVPDGRLIPFCAYNSVGYREQVRRELSGHRRCQRRRA